MMERFAVIILSHGRSDRVYTHATLRRSGYTGPIYILCDDEDEELPQYRERYGDQVIVFRKDDYAGRFDAMDNFGQRSVPVFARNAAWDVARSLGLEVFCVADDDYHLFSYRIAKDGTYKHRVTRNLDALFAAYAEFVRNAPVDAICFAQGGDYIGGPDNQNVRSGYRVLRKMMNLYFFHADRPLHFRGTLNEDLTSSVTEGMVGKVILTTLLNDIKQEETQKNPGGLTETYLEMGTYVKSFYSVIAAPSCVKVSLMGDSSLRLHHEVSWRHAVPKILRAA